MLCAGLGSKDQLQNVEEIASSYGAFAALRSDGVVVTWGDANYGGVPWAEVAPPLHWRNASFGYPAFPRKLFVQILGAASFRNLKLFKSGQSVSSLDSQERLLHGLVGFLQHGFGACIGMPHR